MNIKGYLFTNDGATYPIPKESAITRKMIDKDMKNEKLGITGYLYLLDRKEVDE